MGSEPTRMKAIIKDPQHFKRLAESVQILNERQDFMDLCFVCARGHRVFAHKLLLCSVSSQMKEMFLDNPDNNDLITIHMPDVEARLLKLMFDFLYEGSLHLVQSDYAELKNLMSLLGVVLKSRSDKTSKPSEAPPTQPVQTPQPAQLVYIQPPGPNNQGDASGPNFSPWSNDASGNTRHLHASRADHADGTDYHESSQWPNGTGRSTSRYYTYAAEQHDADGSAEQCPGRSNYTEATVCYVFLNHPHDDYSNTSSIHTASDHTTTTNCRQISECYSTRSNHQDQRRQQCTDEENDEGSRADGPESLDHRFPDCSKNPTFCSIAKISCICGKTATNTTTVRTASANWPRQEVNLISRGRNLSPCTTVVQLFGYIIILKIYLTILL